MGGMALVGCEVNVTDKKTEKNAPAEFAFIEATIADLQQKMKAGTLSSVELVQEYLKRIEAIDKNGPMLHSVIELNPDAVSIATVLDKERKDGKLRGPLHGIPVLVKDNIDTGDKMKTTAGSLSLESSSTPADAFIISRLRQAGAVILGKTNLSEWANFRSSNSCSGWSSRGGQTRNPYMTYHNPCGSSSGSGVAVSANLCVVAVGTETDGSITCPASVNGLVGIKPTVGLVSRSGIIPISATQDTAGPMARTVTDAAILLSVLAAEDAKDAITIGSQKKAVPDYSLFLKIDGLKGKRIGVDISQKSKYPEMNALLEKSIAKVKSLGAEIVEIEFVKAINALGGFEFTILQHEFKEGLNKYLSARKGGPQSLAEVIAYNKNNESRAMPYFKQELLEECEAKPGLEAPLYLEALQKGRDGSRKLLDGLLKTHKLDAFGGLTMGPACAIDPWYGDRWGNEFLTAPAAMTGYPHICVPAGLINELPVGFSFFGAAFTEPALIGMGYAFEQAGEKRPLPSFKGSIFDKV